MYEKRMYGKREPGKGGRRTLGLEFLLPAHAPRWFVYYYAHCRILW